MLNAPYEYICSTQTYVSDCEFATMGEMLAQEEARKIIILLLHLKGSVFQIPGTPLGSLEA